MKVVVYLGSSVSEALVLQVLLAGMRETEEPGPDSGTERGRGTEEAGQTGQFCHRQAGCIQPRGAETGDHRRCWASCLPVTVSASQGRGAEDSDQTSVLMEAWRTRDMCWRIRRSSRGRYPGSPSPVPRHSSSLTRRRSRRRPGAWQRHRGTGRQGERCEIV